MAPRDIVSMLKEAFKDWNEDNAPRLGAALSYYTVFSLAPLLLISIAVAGLVFGEEAARGGIVAQIQGLIGRDAAEAVQGMIENARQARPGDHGHGLRHGHAPLRRRGRLQRAARRPRRDLGDPAADGRRHQGPDPRAPRLVRDGAGGRASSCSCRWP